MEAAGKVAPSGGLGLTVIRGGQTLRTIPDTSLLPPDAPLGEFTMAEILHHGGPRPDLPTEVNRWRRSNAPNLWRGARRVLGCRALHAAHVYGQLYLQVVRGDGTILDYGLASQRVVTDAGAGFIVDALHASATIANLKFHGFGTGTTAESAGQTALVTELTTEYATDNVRPTGTQTESSANIYVTVGTFAPDSGGTLAITEHGIFDQAAVAGGTLLDRSKFTSVGVVASADSIVATYSFTIASGS